MDSDESGTSETELTAHTAAPHFESLLSDMEDPQEDKKSPPPEVPQAGAETDEVTEQTESEEAKSEDTDETAEATDEQPTEVLYPVKINGVEELVTLDELRKGYSRTKDYTQKTQKVAERERELQQELPAVRAERERLADYLTRLEEHVKETNVEPDWTKIQQERPDEFPNVWAQWQIHKDRLEALRQEKETALAAVARDRAQAQQQYLEDQKTKLLEAIPEWKNAETAKSEKAKIIGLAKEMGYTDQDIAELRDHRAILLLRDAVRWREAQKKKPTVQQKIEQVKTATPGAAQSTRPPVTDTTRAIQRLAKTGKREDAAAAFMTMLEGD